MRHALLLFFVISINALAGGYTGGGSSGGTGLLELNGLTADPQTFATGTSGTDFAISSATSTHTFNLPNASATARGLVKASGAQTLGVDLTLSGAAPIISALTASRIVGTDASKQLTSLTYASANTASAMVQRDGSGNFSAGTITAALTGNASTASALAANPAACSTGSFVTDIAADGTLTCTAGVGLVEQTTGFIETGSDKTYVLDAYAAYAYTINTLKIKTASGTATAALKINGTNVTGISAVSISSTIATGTASAANSVAVGDRVTLVLSSSSSPTDIEFTEKVTR